MDPSEDIGSEEAWQAWARVTDEHAPPGERTFRYGNGIRHGLGLTPGPMEKRRTLHGMLWQAFKAWRASRRRTLDLPE